MIYFTSFNYENEELYGTQIEYFQSGVIKEKSYRVKGSKDGTYELYHENGQLLSRYQRYKGKKDSTFEKYNEDGSVIKFENYENGKLIKAKIDNGWSAKRANAYDTSD